MAPAAYTVEAQVPGRSRCGDRRCRRRRHSWRNADRRTGNASRLRSKTTVRPPRLIARAILARPCRIWRRCIVRVPRIDEHRPVVETSALRPGHTVNHDTRPGRSATTTGERTQTDHSRPTDVHRCIAISRRQTMAESRIVSVHRDHRYRMPPARMFPWRIRTANLAIPSRSETDHWPAIIAGPPPGRAATESRSPAPSE